MLKTKAPSPIPYILVALLLLTGGFFWFKGNPLKRLKRVLTSSDAPTTTTAGASNPSGRSFPVPQTVPSGTTIRIDGSTSMVTINQNLKRAFERRFLGTEVISRSGGSNAGIAALQQGTIDLAAVSRPLSDQETAQGLQAVAIASDSIALVVGVNNPFKGKLTPAQVEGIFTGTIVNWSQVGGTNTMIRVINRPAVSGTHQAFKDLVLKGGNFGNTMNITTLSQDATTPLLRALGNDGISYATYAQTINQKTVRVVPIAGLTPNASNYPYSRTLFYAFKNPPNPTVQAFLGYALSTQGRQAIFRD